MAQSVIRFAAWFFLAAACLSRDTGVVDLENGPTALVTQRRSRDDRIHVALAVFHSKAGFKQEGRKSSNEKHD